MRNKVSFFLSSFNFKRIRKNVFLLVALISFIVSITFANHAFQFEKQQLETQRLITIARAKDAEQNNLKGTVLVKAQTANQAVTDNAEQIIIPSVKISTNVTESKIVDGFWQVASFTASHGQGSANPGQAGNMVIFAHARVGLFAPLENVRKGDNVYILTKNTWYRYSIIYTKLVSPTDVSVVSPSKDERLTLYTCSGPFDEKRFVATALRQKS